MPTSAMPKQVLVEVAVHLVFLDLCLWTQGQDNLTSLFLAVMMSILELNFPSTNQCTNGDQHKPIVVLQRSLAVIATN
ncbi:hypothetical protein BDZ85DRAFT_256605 [Elsinoe ampelina]|uniref:Uncharacterized protein n=1 Tax=Elsinoe ampelina TaxID=302913 RepID=A0A6A6GMW8_9PEZI|nr:hypothetical protein BDZ85DRAFT_256605 [Elsinoe ampelina]